MASPVDRLVTRLDAAAEHISARGATSASRSRQVRWVAGELRRALEHEDFGDLPQDVRSLFSRTPLQRYLTLAREGALRVAPYRRTTPSPASERVRLDCLALLASELGVALPDLARPVPPVLKDTVPERQQQRVWAHLDVISRDPRTTPGRVRLLAMVGVVLDTGARAGELCAMRVEDLAPDLSSVRFHRRPQALRVNEPALDQVALSAGTRVAMRRWLEERELIVGRLEGTMAALWVSVRGNHVETSTGRSVPRPAGMPLQSRGLRRAYERAVDELNVDFAGTPDWQPLPSRLEQLRRGIPVPAE